MAVFKAYDIRGTVPDELDPALAYRIGAATARFLDRGRLVVGRDARTHSPEIGDALRQGMLDAGADVLDIGRVTTPMVYFAVESEGAAGGAMVTASHNPGRYNGFKICREHAIPIGEASGLKEIEALTARIDGEVRGPHGPGTLAHGDVVEGYVDHVLAAFGRALPEGPLTVAIDCANGMASVPLERLLARWEADGRVRTERLYFEPDGTFPNHEADPLKVENLADLIEAVKRSGAAFGVGFDGDGDRAVFVDEGGRPISSDLTTALLARHQLRDHPGARVLYDLRSSRAVAEAITAAGGEPEMCRVGHSFVKAHMREAGALFAGELSGHFYFRFSEQLVADDAVAAFVAVLAALAAEDEPLSALIDPLRRYHASGEINRTVADTGALLEAIEREHADAPTVSRLDGLYVAYDDWWFNLRPSNTEPVLRLNLEADTREKMEAERDRLLARMVGG